MVSEDIKIRGKECKQSLNPCCGGRWSQSKYDYSDAPSKNIVLILVVVEDGLRVYIMSSLIMRS